MSAGSSATARDCVRSALASLELPVSAAADYQLWARATGDEPPYPLIGHELPAAIQLHALREAAAEERAHMDHCNNIYGTGPAAGCQFVLRCVGRRRSRVACRWREGGRELRSGMLRTGAGAMMR